MANSFSPGDLVQLKSGGPPMTVSKITGDDYVETGYRCEWFRGAAKENSHFYEHTLQAYVAPAKS